MQKLVFLSVSILVGAALEAVKPSHISEPPHKEESANQLGPERPVTRTRRPGRRKGYNAPQDPRASEASQYPAPVSSTSPTSQDIQ